MVTKVKNPVLDLLSPAIGSQAGAPDPIALFGRKINMGGQNIENLADPVVNQDAATKFYVDQVASTAGGGVFLPAGFGPIPWSGEGPSIPVGWLLCDGASYPTATYPDLFAAIGYTYGGGGANFNVPDMRGRVPAGMDDFSPEYTTSFGPAGRVTAGAADILGGTFGADTHTLTEAQLASHDHGGSVTGSGNHGHTGSTDNPGNHTHSQYGGPTCAQGSGSNTLQNCGFNSTGGGGAHTHTVTILSSGGHSHGLNISDAGSDQPHNNVQPTIFFGYIIKSSDATLAFPGDIVMAGSKITDLGAPTAGGDATNKTYVDNAISTAVEAKNSYDISLYFGSTVNTAPDQIARFPAVRTFEVASLSGNSAATARVASTGVVNFEIRKNGTPFGTMTFNASATGTFSVSAVTTFNPGDIMQVAVLNTDPTLEDIGITIKARIP